MSDGSSSSQPEKKKKEFTQRQLDLFVRMLEKYLEWAETVPEILMMEEE
jgi:hypothetical protein